MASLIPSTHKGHGFRYVQAGNTCYLRAGAATCIEFKVSRTSEFFFQIANYHMVTLPHRPFVQEKHRNYNFSSEQALILCELNLEEGYKNV